MSSPELITVFSALMALIALVTIGIDWIGRPLRNRRFIPRMYRFEDEKLPLDAYGNVTMAPGPYPPAVPMAAPPLPAPMPRRDASARRRQAAPVVVAQVGAGGAVAAARVVAPAATVGGAFSTTVAQAGTVRSAASAAARSTAQPAEPTGRPTWRPGMGLDATVDDQKPSLAVKAERFWKSIGPSLADSHFDDDDRQQMALGNSPRRINPRTGRVEVMQLSGLREASSENDVRMSWPDDSTDPWSPQ